MALLLQVLVSIALVAVATSYDTDVIPDLSFKLTGSNLAFPCDSTRNIFLTTGRYVKKNIIATRTQIYKDSVIVALPRYKQGVPFTLARFSLKNKECKATLIPFPCWSIQEEGNCEALQSVVDIFLDQRELLWVLDVGVVNTLEQPVRRCPPKLVALNARTGQVVKIIDLTPFATSLSHLQYVVVDFDIEGNSYAYISDAGTGAIIVYDIHRNKGHRVVLPRAASDGCTQRDVLYISLIRKPNEKLLYFTYLSSPRLFYIRTQNLQKGETSGAIVDVGPKPNGNRIVILGTDDGTGLFFRYKGESDIYIWNTLSCFKSDNFLLVQKGDEYKLATQVVPGYKRLMWVLESNFHDFLTNTAGSLGPSMSVHPLIKTCED